ncbi:MAG: hypothetical protein EOL88_07325 [Bacteroidia bacterium]|nr:hypothetical protein [Bacteroidales bacterium]NCD41888.1 hypothetical protein [Bacteroidia bacterium]MDD2323045.1 hypothetical protein [Bacteroidales bacterium]MDD3011578.1 hypothetical protein [Bacteroidales bacterium]MDD3962056.1 hypothetical protein [Bacteroidales bacterium]
MITRLDFDNADNVDRLAMVFDEGREILSRIYVYYVVKLYLLNDFYVEVWYRQESNTIDKIKRVEMDDVFHLYAPTIDISDVFEP